RHGADTRLQAPADLKIEFDVFEYGCYKRRLIEGDPEDADDWTVGHPLIFPYILCVGQGTSYSYQIRVPVDDTHTLHIVMYNRPRRPDDPHERSHTPVTWRE